MEQDDASSQRAGCCRDGGDGDGQHRLLREWGRARSDAEVAVLAVHGREQSPSFMQQESNRFGPVPARFYAPEAENNTWYPRPFMEPISHNQPDVDQALETIDSCRQQLVCAGFPADKTVLWGFSQGACVVAQYLLTAPRQFAGALLFTGGYIGTSPPRRSGNHPLREVPVVVRSIENDPWVDKSRVEETATLLKASGATVDLQIAAGFDHTITDEACGAAAQLLRQVSDTGE